MKIDTQFNNFAMQTNKKCDYCSDETLEFNAAEDPEMRGSCAQKAKS